MSVPVLAVNLTAGYQNRTVLQDVHFTLQAGERLGLLGTSAAGKSTLVLALLGLLAQRRGWVRGEVHIAGQNLLALSRRDARALRGKAIALVPQSSVAALNPALTIRAHFQQAWRAHTRMPFAQMDRRIQDLFERVALPSSAEFLARKPGQISVGQAQRCTLALALLHQPQVILADEPTSALDSVTQQEVLTLLKQTCAEFGTALLFVSHDLLSVFALCDRIALLDQGVLSEHIGLSAIAETSHPALRRLLNTLPVPLEMLMEHRTRSAEQSTRVLSEEALPTPLS